jgi:hypothetical protein
MARIRCIQRPGGFMDAMRKQGRRAVRASMACLLVGTIAAGAQGTPDYSRSRASVCLPFANPPQDQAFTEPPKLRFSVNGGRVKMVAIDTGSVGIAMAFDQIPNFHKLKAHRSARPGFQFLSSSNLLWKGTWVPATVTFYGSDGSTPVATAAVPVLGVEQEVVCQDYQGDGTCGNIPLRSARGREIAYMGVGFGREEDHQPQGTPDKNPLLHLTTIAGRKVAARKLNQGYIIGSTGVTVGLTRENTRNFRFIKLTPSAKDPGDWMAARMCVKLNDSRCFPGTVLVDTGIPQSYITVPTAADFRTVEARDASEPSRQIEVLAPGTRVEVNLPGLPDPVALDRYTVGRKTPEEPLQVIPWKSDTRPTFVNTGRHFLRKYQFLYDARNGYIGLKPQAGGCAE